MLIIQLLMIFQYVDLLEDHNTLFIFLYLFIMETTIDDIIFEFKEVLEQLKNNKHELNRLDLDHHINNIKDLKDSIKTILYS